MKSPNSPNEYDRTLSLREYRLLHPHTADYPTLSESTVIGALLERRRRRLERAARRHEFYRNMLALPGKTAIRAWNWAVALVPQKSVSQPAPAVARPAFAKFDQPAQMRA
ncbi:hypothetical protein DES53_10917 [Roseimicrobium gellanilyticum]|uniref:Uncharacterized protein n=1 Tax=Roseimicrobium gellanilyticum TaxID=748857 RepID=A0A366HC92_9BACT|nr:hypothetical protein [Roseimicrobium gellanilyticum]RBP39590.1 hypothetical protein DES53_10917 [Roseimicrobium gellanilyticum]